MIFTISGPSGAGKTTLVKSFISKNPSVKRVITCTSRLPREHEKEGEDYYFITKEDFEEGKYEFIEKIIFDGNYYGTRKDSFSGDCIVVVDKRGAEKIKEVFGAKKVRTIYLMLSKEKALARSKKRNNEVANLIRQQEDEKRDLFDRNGYDCVINADRKKKEVLNDLIGYYISQTFTPISRKEKQL